MRKTRLKQAFLLILLTGIVYACLDENGLPSGRSLATEVVEAQKWYISQVPEGSILWKSSNGERANTYKPVWKRAFWNEDADYKVTEIHLEGEDPFVFAAYECIQKYQATSDTHYMASDTRLVIRTNKKTQEKDAFIMVVYPDLSYIEAHKDHPLRDISYLKRDKEFSGMIYYHNLEGEFVNGWKYIDGKAYALYPKGKANTSIGTLLRGGEWGDDESDETCYYLVFYTDYYINGDYAGTVYDNMIYLGCFDNNNYGGGNGDIGNGTNGNSPYVPSATDCMAKPNLPITMVQQLLNTCVTSIMEYINNHVFGGDMTDGDYQLSYLQNYNTWVYANGVGLDNIVSFTNMHFTTSFFSSLQAAIDAGAVVMTNIGSDGDSTHNVLIVGYQPGGYYIYMDPETGSLHTRDESSFDGDYAIGITGIK